MDDFDIFYSYLKFSSVNKYILSILKIYLLSRIPSALFTGDTFDFRLLSPAPVPRFSLVTFDFRLLSPSPLSTFDFSLSTTLPVPHACHAGLEPASTDPGACFRLLSVSFPVFDPYFRLVTFHFRLPFDFRLFTFDL